MKKMVILLSGKLQSGKNQFSEFLSRDLISNGLSVRQDLFAKDLKDGCKNDFRRLSDVLMDIRREIISNVEIMSDLKQTDKTSFYGAVDKLIIKDENWYEKKTPITRVVLQLYGTEIFRNRVSYNYWAERVRDRVIERDEQVTIVTDCRFPNEITVFDKENLGEHINNIIPIAIRINRDINTNRSLSNHDSETALDGWKEWDYIVDNNGSLDDLKKASKTVAENIKEYYME